MAHNKSQGNPGCCDCGQVKKNPLILILPFDQVIIACLGVWLSWEVSMPQNGHNHVFKFIWACVTHLTFAVTGFAYYCFTRKKEKIYAVVYLLCCIFSFIFCVVWIYFCIRHIHGKSIHKEIVCNYAVALLEVLLVECGFCCYGACCFYSFMKEVNFTKKTPVKKREKLDE